MEKCRACLTTEVFMFPMDEDFIHNYNILTNLDVKPSDNMPQVICENCLQSVKFFVEFREKCILSETSLRSIKEDVKVETQDVINDIKTEYETDCAEYLDDVDFPEDFEELIKKEDVAEPKKVKKKYKKTKPKKQKQKTPAKVILEPCEISLYCGLCPKKFDDKEKLVTHLEEHRTCRSCSLCPQSLRCWAHVLGHRMLHVPAEQQACHLCNKRFLSSSGLEFHFRKIHLNEKDIVINCDLCLNPFITPRRLRKHMWSVHSDKKFICDYCNKAYATKNALRIHIRSHMDNKLFSCDLCDFACKHRGGLKDHKIRKHAAIKVYCRECKRPFESQEKCDTHKCGLRSKPQAICPICGLELKRGVRLTRHMEIHKEVGRYKCSRCPKVYKARGALTVHMNQHDGNRNLRCEFCPATFYYPSVLGKHRRIHTGEKPYVCKICNRGFTGNHNLKVHMKVHGEHNLIIKRVKPEVIEA